MQRFDSTRFTEEENLREALEASLALINKEGTIDMEAPPELVLVRNAALYTLSRSHNMAHISTYRSLLDSSGSGI